VLVISLPTGRFTVEMTPVPDRWGEHRGVVAEGPVGVRLAGRWRIFRYEVRRWRDGVVPDLDAAVESPLCVAGDLATARRVFDALPSVPARTWGRDEERLGDMWSCNSVISWALTRAGIATEAVPLPRCGRAPGWDAGIEVARRAATADREPSSGRPSVRSDGRRRFGERRRGGRSGTTTLEIGSSSSSPGIPRDPAA
jgi:hypothetical protein